MPTTLTAVSDPVQAHNLWKAGLLVNKYGKRWNAYERYVSQPSINRPDAPSFIAHKSDWFILLEE